MTKEEKKKTQIYKEYINRIQKKRENDLQLE